MLIHARTQSQLGWKTELLNEQRRHIRHMTFRSVSRVNAVEISPVWQSQLVEICCCVDRVCVDGVACVASDRQRRWLQWRCRSLSPWPSTVHTCFRCRLASDVAVASSSNTSCRFASFRIDTRKSCRNGCVVLRFSMLRRDAIRLTSTQMLTPA